MQSLSPQCKKLLLHSMQITIGNAFLSVQWNQIVSSSDVVGGGGIGMAWKEITIFAIRKKFVAAFPPFCVIRLWKY